MVAMPYIQVDIIMGMVSPAFFCLTLAGLLSKIPWVAGLFPALWGSRRLAAFLALCLALPLLVYVLIRVLTGLGHWTYRSPVISDKFLFLGWIFSILLTYQALSRRFFKTLPGLWRRFLLAFLSFILTAIPLLAVVTVIIILFVIR